MRRNHAQPSQPVSMLINDIRVVQHKKIDEQTNDFIANGGSITCTKQGHVNAPTDPRLFVINGKKSPRAK